jgi:hypothetical protein
VAVNVADIPWQIVDELTVIAGAGFTTTVAVAVAWHPLAS